jgi:hypothetical protein
VLSRLKKSIAGSIGRRMFRRAIRETIPDYVHGIQAVEYPIPFFRSDEWPLVSFSCREPFERDLLVTGWDDYTKQTAVAVVVCMAHRTGVHPGRVYTRWLPGEQTRVWLILDESQSHACFYMTGVDTC